MAIQYAGGTNVNFADSVTTRNGFFTLVTTQLTNAGWTSTAFAAQSTLTVSGNAANNETVTLNATVYTFKTVINNATPFEVLVGANAAASISNLFAAVNLGAGAGTAYSSATTLHATIEGVTLTTTTALFAEKVGGVTSGYASTDTLGSGSFSSATLTGGGYTVVSAATPAFQQCKLWLHDYGETDTGRLVVRARLSNVDGSKISSSFGAGNGANVQITTTGTTFRVIASRYQGFVFTPGGFAQWGYLAFGVPYIETFQTAKQITNATNTSPIVITSTSHGFSNGDNVYVTQVGGNTGANGSQTVANITANTFELAASVGNGAYTTGGVVGELDVQVAEAMFLFDATNGSNAVFRNCLGTVTQTTGYFSNVNGSIQGFGASGGIGAPQVFVGNYNRFTSAQQLWYNTTYVVSEAFLAYNAVVGTQGKIIGQLYDSVVVGSSFTADVTGSFDSHSWFNMTDTFAGGATNAQGSVLVVIP